MREAKEAIFNTEEVVAVDQAMIDRLKRRAAESPRHVFRLCMHRSTDDAVQEMVVAFHEGAYSRPHRHPHSSASIHIIEGEMDVFVFDREGAVTGKHELGVKGSGKAFCLRNEADCWHMTVPKSEFTVMHEAIAGPFVRETSNIFADWSPAESDTDAVATYMNKLYGET